MKTNKELSPLEALQGLSKLVFIYGGVEQYNTIEKALVRLETLEECYMSLTETNMELVQEQARNQKKLKALEIIKKKKVNIFTFYECCSWFNPSNYNDSLGCPVNCELTQEEYDLLKEVLL